MRIALVDDTKEYRDTLEEYILRFSKENGIDVDLHSFSSPKEFIEANLIRLDICFFDIQMPEMDGIELGRKVRETDNNTLLVYITNFPQYALQGYEVNAFDFIVKPLSYEQFSIKFEKAIRQVKPNKKMTITSESEKIVINMRDIVYIEGANQYIYIHLKDRTHKVNTTLKSIEQYLDKGFSRCNNSYIVNLNEVTKIEKDYIVAGKDRLPVSRSKKKEFIEDLNKFLGGIR